MCVYDGLQPSGGWTTPWNWFAFFFCLHFALSNSHTQIVVDQNGKIEFVFFFTFSSRLFIDNTFWTHIHSPTESIHLFRCWRFALLYGFLEYFCQSCCCRRHYRHHLPHFSLHCSNLWKDNTIAVMQNGTTVYMSSNCNNQITTTRRKSNKISSCRSWAVISFSFSLSLSISSCMASPIAFDVRRWVVVLEVITYIKRSKQFLFCLFIFVVIWIRFFSHFIFVIVVISHRLVIKQLFAASPVMKNEKDMIMKNVWIYDDEREQNGMEKDERKKMKMKITNDPMIYIYHSFVHGEGESRMTCVWVSCCAPHLHHAMPCHGTVTIHLS